MLRTMHPEDGSQGQPGHGFEPPRRPTYEGHPLFPRADGSPEDADIRYVSFLRRVDGVLKHCPEDIPRDQVQSWDQVTDWWGGGDYQAIAKTENHVVIRHYPNKAEWVSLDGEPLPLVKRGPRQAAAAHARRAPEAAEAAQPAGLADVLGKLVDRLDRMEQRMDATPAASGGGQEFLSTILTLQTEAQKAQALVQQEQIRQAGETSRMMMQMMMKGGKADDSESKLVALLGMLKPYLKPDAAPHPPAAPDPFTILERAQNLGLLGAPAGPSLASEIKPIAETVGNVITQQIQAEGKAKVAEAEVRKAEILAARPEAPPQRRDRDRDPPPLTYVEGLGMVHVVVPTSAPAHVAGVRAAVGPAPSAPVAAALAAAAPPPAVPPVAPAPTVSAAPPAAPPPSPAPAEPGPPMVAEQPAPPQQVARAGQPRSSHLRLVAVQPALPPQVAPPPQPGPPAPAEAAVPLAPPGSPASSEAPVPPFVEDMPPEVRSALGAAAAEVTLEDKAQLAGMFGRLKELPVTSRVPVIQKFFPAYNDKEATDLAKMVDELPMMQLWGLVDSLAPAEVRRINGLNGSKA